MTQETEEQPTEAPTERQLLHPHPPLAVDILASPASEDDSNWLLSYVDLFTLLVVMFVVMLSFSSPTEMAKLPPPQEVVKSITPETGAAAGQHKLLTQFQQQLAGLVEQGQIEISASAAGISLQLEEEIMFGSGAAELLAQGKEVLKGLTPALQQSGQAIRVEGHTDDRPIATARFPSNWELSGSRAARVVRYLNEQGIPAQSLSATGYADTRPVANNDTQEGRARNRRVTLLVKPASAAEEPATDPDIHPATALDD